MADGAKTRPLGSLGEGQKPAPTAEANYARYPDLAKQMHPLEL